MARPYPGSAYPASPAPTTASSLNYSQYGASPATSRSNTGPSSSYSGSRAPPMAPMRSVTSSSTGLKPPAGKKDSREIARVHWQALKDFLREWLQNESPTARASAREKLTRLTKLQFQELSTDVYDELSRRIEVESGPPSATAPFLPVRDDFHPKRNQARQKLATLPKNRFKDLASDVYYELRRRYPEFEEEVGDQLKCEADKQTQEMMYEEPRAPSRSERPAHQRQGSRQASVSSNTAPQYNSTANDVVIPNKSRLREEDAPSPFDNRPDKPGTSRNDVIIPNKSRMREEEIEVPYARDSSLVDDRPTSAASSRRLSRISQASSYKPAATPRAEPAPDMLSPQSNDDRNYYERLSFSSNVTSKSKMPAAEDEREQKIRSDYEFRIAGLERRALAAESERDECRRREVEEKEKRVEWEDEVRGLKERAALHASALRSMQHELDLARDAATTARQHMEESSRNAQEEIDQWRDRCEGLEDNLRNAEADRSTSAPNNDAVAELRNEIHSLVAELNSLSARNDDLVGEREQDAQTMNEMEARVAEYKRKYDSVRIELRNLKATSTMFTSKPLSDDHLPASPDGNISDINVSSFQNAIDGMLTAARSSTPSGVLPAMKAIVEAITEIGEDVKSFEAKPNLDVDVSRLESLKHESTARLNGLMQAARNHAMASGLSPVSLIDAAAGHLSANVVEIIKLLKIRRSRSDAPRAEPMQRQRSSLSIKDMVNRDVRRPDLLEPQRQLSIDSSSSRLGEKLVSPTESRLNGITGAVGGMLSNFRVNSFQSSRSDSFDLERKASVASSYDRPTPKAQVSYGRDSPISTSSSAPPPEQEEDIGGSAQEWEEVKPYLETQSSALVNSIQNLLAAIRTGGQTPALNEHLSEVIAIASSIVAVSTNALPSSLKGEGGPLLRDLVTNTNRLSEAQEQAKTGGFDKAVRQVIASASFGVAKSLKALMKLGTE